MTSLVLENREKYIAALQDSTQRPFVVPCPERPKERSSQSRFKGRKSSDEVQVAEPSGSERLRLRLRALRALRASFIIFLGAHVLLVRSALRSLGSRSLR